MTGVHHNRRGSFKPSILHAAPRTEWQCGWCDSCDFSASPSTPATHTVQERDTAFTPNLSLNFRGPHPTKISAAPAKIPSTPTTRPQVARSFSTRIAISNAVTIPVSRSAASGAVGPSDSAYSDPP